MELNSKKLMLCYPSEKIGGCQTFIYRIAKRSSIQKQVIIVDYKNGIVANKLKVEKIEFKHVICKNDNMRSLRENMKLVDSTSCNYLAIFPNELNEDICTELCKIKTDNIHYYFTHPEDLINYFPFMGRVQNIGYKKVIIKILFNNLFKTCKKFLLDNIKSKKIIFMDYENFWLNNYMFDLNLKPEDVNFLPIPIEVFNRNKWINREKCSNEIDLCWLGTLVSWKIPILKKIILDLKLLTTQNNYTINLNIIGNGDALDDLKIFINKENIKFSINFKGTLIDDNLNKELLQNDILFAMGTSALEGAKLGIPTILVDATKFIPNMYKYNWLYDTYYYTLGRIITNDRKRDINDKGYNLNEIIAQFVDSKEELSYKSFEYCKNHDINNVYEKMNEYFQEVESKEFKITYNNIIDSKNRNIICKISDFRNKIKIYLHDRCK